MNKRIAKKIIKRSIQYTQCKLRSKEDMDVCVPYFNYSDLQVRKASLYLDRMQRKHYNKHCNWNYRE